MGGREKETEIGESCLEAYVRLSHCGCWEIDLVRMSDHSGWGGWDLHRFQFVK